MDLLIFWLIFAMVVAFMAGSRGRSGFGWFMLAVFITPLLAGLLVVILPNRKQPVVVVQGYASGTIREMRTGSVSESQALHRVTCPHCHKLVALLLALCVVLSFEQPANAQYPPSIFDSNKYIKASRTIITVALDGRVWLHTEKDVIMIDSNTGKITIDHKPATDAQIINVLRLWAVEARGLR